MSTINLVRIPILFLLISLLGQTYGSTNKINILPCDYSALKEPYDFCPVLFKLTSDCSGKKYQSAFSTPKNESSLWRKDKFGSPRAGLITTILEDAGFSSTIIINDSNLNTENGRRNENSIDRAVKSLSCGEHPDYNALIDFYDSTNGPNWLNNSGWPEGKAGISCDPCNFNGSPWYGLNCRNGRVTCLDMDGEVSCGTGTGDGNNLNGPLPKSINQLTQLEYLILSKNKITGQLIDEVYDLTNLKWLTFNGDEFTNSISSRIGELKNLVILAFWNSQLSGSIPTSVTQLDKLRQLLIITAPNMSGTIPTNIGDLKTVSRLDIIGTKITGPIPESIGQMTNLVNLSLPSNELNGSIPSSLANLFSLTAPMSFNNNNLEDCFPEALKGHCSIYAFEHNFTNNINLSWQGDYARFCSGESQIGAFCGSDNLIDENCECTNDIMSPDIVAPLARCKTKSINLIENSATISAIDFNNGSSDEGCGTDISFEVRFAGNNSWMDVLNINCTHLFSDHSIDFRVLDCANNVSATCRTTLTVSNTQKPSISCPSDVSEEIPFGQLSKIVTGISPNNTSNNCSNSLTTSYELSGATNGRNNGNANGLSFNLGTTTVTYTIMNEVGNTNNCSFTVTLKNPDCTLSNEVQTTPSTCEKNNGKATAFPNGGIGNYTYNWSTGATSKSIENLTIGNYSVTVSDSFCSSSESFTITGKPLPIVTIEGNNTLCINTSSSLSAKVNNGNENITLLWEDGSSNAARNINPNQTTTYAVTITDENGCKAIDEITVNVLDPATDIGQDIEMCQGETVVLDAIVENATYQWSNGATTKNIEVNTSDTYFVTVSLGNNCTATDDLKVTVNPLPEVDAGNTSRLTCDTPIDTLSGKGSTGLAFDSQWTSTDGNIQSGETTFNPIVNSAGIYVLKITNNLTQCIATDQVIIIADNLPPTIDIGSNKTICIDETITVNVQCDNCTYLWEDGSTSSIRLKTPLNSTTYSVTATDDKGCSTSDDVFIEVLNPNFDLGENKVICNGQETTLMVNLPDATYQWNTGQTTPSIAVTEAGAYSVTLTLREQCPASDEIEVVVNPLPIANAGSLQKITCEFPQIALDANASSSSSQTFEYLWNSENGGNIVSGNNTLMPIVDEPGIYKLLVTNVNTQCQNSAMVEVTIEENIPRGADINTTDLSCANSNDGQVEILRINGGFSPYTYSLDGIIFQQEANFENLNPGIHQVIIKDKNTCELTLSELLIEEPKPLTVAIKGLEEVAIYADSELNLEANVQNAQGFVNYIWEGEKLEENNEQEITVYPAYPSIYILKIIDDQNCEAIDSLFVPVIKFGAPQENILTPSIMDGMNDNLVFPDIDDDEKYPHNEITIFNRWGQKVYHAKPYMNDWNGVSDTRENLPEGTYYYIFTLNVGEGDILHGSILLLR